MKSLKTKPLLLAALALLAIVLVAAIKLVNKPKEETETGQPPAPKIEEVNQIPIKERPFIEIIPRSDGREVRLTIDRLGNASKVEYELEYQAGTLLQGAFGNIDFTKEKAPVTRNILLGSCSAGGKCSYHEDVNGGTLLLRYTNAETVFLKGEWNFQVMSKQNGRFSSRDAKFNFDVGKGGLPTNTFAVVAQTLGLPGPVEGEIVGGPYSLTLPPGVSQVKKAINLTMRTTATDKIPRLLGWSEDGWIEYQAEISDKTLEATVDRATTFIAVTTSNSQ